MVLTAPVQFSCSDDRWPLVPLLIWIATRRHYAVEECASLSPRKAEIWLDQARARELNFEEGRLIDGWDRFIAIIRDGRLSGRGRRYSLTSRVVAAAPLEAFPHFGEGLEYELHPDSGCILVGGIGGNEWRELSFDRATVFALWPPFNPEPTDGMFDYPRYELEPLEGGGITSLRQECGSRGSKVQLAMRAFVALWGGVEPPYMSAKVRNEKIREWLHKNGLENVSERTIISARKELEQRNNP